MNYMKFSHEKIFTNQWKLHKIRWIKSYFKLKISELNIHGQFLKLEN
jgi:hypothetical protein